jgi:ABC-2 type transport system permease protein
MKAPPSQPVARAQEADRGHAAKWRGHAHRFGLTAFAALYTLTLRQHLHGKRWLVLGALLLTPALLAIILQLTAPDVPGIVLEFALVFMFIPQALLPLVALLYGSGIIQDELEEQTFTYLLVRPIPKWAIYGIKLLATLTTAVALTAVFTTLTYLMIYVGAASDPGAEDLAVRCVKAVCFHGLAIVAYCCIFGLLSLLTRWMLVVGFLYAAFFEGLLANLPFSVRLLSVIYYARVMVYRSMEFHLTPPGGHAIDLAAEAWQLEVRRDPGLLSHPAFGTCLLVLLTGSLACTGVAAFLTWRREFYVKTPERV